MAPPLIQLSDIALTFGGAPLLGGVDLAVSRGDRLCLIGRNGSGKSTLLKIVAGLVEADRGTRFVQPGATVRYLPQEPDFGGHATTLAYVEAGLTPGDDLYAAQRLLDDLGVDAQSDPTTLSGGEARRAAIARVLAPEPDILLLDEPTNHLDLTTIEWLEKELASRRSALVIISHDRRFLSNLSRATAWLDRGAIRRIDKGFSAFEGWRDDVLAEEEREQHKLDRKIVAEEHWLRYGVSGRRKRNVKRLANLHTLRDQRQTHRGPTGAAALAASEAEASGKLVVEAKHIARAFADKTVVQDFSIRIQRGDRIGIVGPNGAGKTTLVNTLIGTDKPDSGSIRFGANIEMATLDQHRESLDPRTTLADALTGGRGDQVMVGGKPRHVAGYMKDFLFAPEQMRTPLEVLSGGERGRLMLARALAKPSNVLILDEPTNDLDLETLDVLEDMLGDYDGTVILISHDRDFLDRVVTSTLAPAGDGRWIEYAGGYSDMLTQRGTVSPASASGKRIVSGDGPVASASSSASKRKLSFKDKHALDTLPRDMDKLAKDIAALQKILDDATLYTTNRAKFDDTSRAIGDKQTALAAAEERWLELEMLREDIEGSAA